MDLVSYSSSLNDDMTDEDFEKESIGNIRLLLMLKLSLKLTKQIKEMKQLEEHEKKLN